jgi:plasmid segregation protein ParM
MFSFDGMEFQVTVTDVSLFPQGYAAVLSQTGLLDEPSVIVADIGGWTVDLMRLDNRIPSAATCRSLELGMIRCLDEISEQLRRTLGLSMTAAQIESQLRGDPVSMDEGAKRIIQQQADAYVRRLLSAIAESGLDVRAMPTIFLGGGAALLKRNTPEALCRPSILDDVCLNAKGYERLVAQLSRHGG